jgi:hypothetical protein
MSRQSKQAKNAARAKMFANGGPKSTTPKHGKDPAKRIYTARSRSLEAFQAKGKEARKSAGKPAAGKGGRK